MSKKLGDLNITTDKVITSVTPTSLTITPIYTSEKTIATTSDNHDICSVKYATEIKLKKDIVFSGNYSLGNKKNTSNTYTASANTTFEQMLKDLFTGSQVPYYVGYSTTKIKASTLENKIENQEYDYIKKLMNTISQFTDYYDIENVPVGTYNVFCAVLKDNIPSGKNIYLYTVEGEGESEVETPQDIDFRKEVIFNDLTYIFSPLCMGSATTNVNKYRYKIENINS